MAYTFEQVKHGYANLWDKALVRPASNALAMKEAKRILDAEAQLKEVEAATDVPWFMVGVMLYRESDLNFETYLGNGQSLHHVTTEVPAGRGPFSSFLAGAIDAIKHEGMYKIGPWTLEFILFWLERFNGEGYFAEGINDPYLWSWTTLYTSGKFVGDHQFSRTDVDSQGGCAAILKALFEIDPTLMPPRIAGGPPMTQVPQAQAPQLPQINLADAAGSLNTVIGLLPLVANFVPQLKPIAVFIPLIQGALKLVIELETAPHDPASVATIIETHLKNVVNDLQAFKVPPFPGAPNAGA